MNRLAFALAALIAVSPAAFASELSFDVKKTATCGCCQAWVDYIKAAGHKVETSNMDMGSLTQHKMKLGITPNTPPATPPRSTVTSSRATCRSRT